MIEALTDADDTLEIENDEHAVDAIEAGEIAQNDEIAVEYIGDDDEQRTEAGRVTEARVERAGTEMGTGKFTWEVDTTYFVIEYEVEGKNDHTIYSALDGETAPILKTEVGGDALNDAREIGPVFGIEVAQGERCCAEGCDNALPPHRSSGTCSSGCALQVRQNDDSDDEDDVETDGGVDSGFDEDEIMYEVRCGRDGDSIHARTFDDEDDAYQHAREMNELSDDLAYMVHPITAEEERERKERAAEALETLREMRDEDGEDETDQRAMADGGTNPDSVGIEDLPDDVPDLIDSTIAAALDLALDDGDVTPDVTLVEASTIANPTLDYQQLAEIARDMGLDVDAMNDAGLGIADSAADVSRREPDAVHEIFCSECDGMVSADVWNGEIGGQRARDVKCHNCGGEGGRVDFGFEPVYTGIWPDPDTRDERLAELRRDGQHPQISER